jgi:hypothetical protein
LRYFIDAGQAGRKFVDIDQEVPGFLHGNIKIDLTVKNHRAIYLKIFSRAILFEKKCGDKSATIKCGSAAGVFNETNDYSVVSRSALELFCRRVAGVPSW